MKSFMPVNSETKHIFLELYRNHQNYIKEERKLEESTNHPSKYPASRWLVQHLILCYVNILKQD